MSWIKITLSILLTQLFKKTRISTPWKLHHRSCILRNWNCIMIQVLCCSPWNAAFNFANHPLAVLTNYPAIILCWASFPFVLLSCCFGTDLRFLVVNFETFDDVLFNTWLWWRCLLLSLYCKMTSPWLLSFQGQSFCGYYCFHTEITVQSIYFWFWEWLHSIFCVCDVLINFKLYKPYWSCSNHCLIIPVFCKKLGNGVFRIVILLQYFILLL